METAFVSSHLHRLSDVSGDKGHIIRLNREVKGVLRKFREVALGTFILAVRRFRRPPARSDNRTARAYDDVSEIVRVTSSAPPGKGPVRRRRTYTREARLRHRYEIAHEQPLRSAIRGLLALARSGVDLPDEAAPEAVSEAAPEAVAAPAKADASRKLNSSCNNSETCVGLVSVGAAAPHEAGLMALVRSPRRPGRPTGADPGPKSPPDLSPRFADMDGCGVGPAASQPAVRPGRQADSGIGRGHLFILPPSIA